MGEETHIVRGHKLVDHITPARGPVDTSLIPSYGGHVAKVIFEGSKRTPPILDCRPRKRTLDAIIRL